MSFLIFFESLFEGLIKGIEIEFVFVDDFAFECTDRFEIPSFFCVYEGLCHLEVFGEM